MKTWFLFRFLLSQAENNPKFELIANQILHALKIAAALFIFVILVRLSCRWYDGQNSIAENSVNVYSGSLESSIELAAHGEDPTVENFNQTRYLYSWKKSKTVAELSKSVTN